jgi:hypothetical protein
MRPLPVQRQVQMHGEMKFRRPRQHEPDWGSVSHCVPHRLGVGNLLVCAEIADEVHSEGSGDSSS